MKSRTLALKGPTECNPGAPCSMLRHVLAETERLAPAKPGAGLETFLRFPQVDMGIGYRPGKGRGVNLIALTYCPWCGERIAPEGETATATKARGATKEERR